MTTPKFLFLPGTLCDSRVFDELTAQLVSVDCDISLIDYQMAADLPSMAVQVEKQANGQEVILIAFSMGGMVAFECIRRANIEISGLVLLASNANADGEGKADIRAQHLRMAREQGLGTLINNIYMPQYLYRQAPEHQTLILNMAESLGLDVFSAQLQVLAKRPAAYSELSRFLAPLLIIGGQEDPLCPPSEQAKMHASNPNSSKVILPNVGHFVTLEAAKEVSDKIVLWLTQHFHRSIHEG